LISSPAPRQFAYLSLRGLESLDGRNELDIELAVPTLYELSISPTGSGTYELKKVHRTGKLGKGAWLLQEILPGRLDSYANLIGDYKIVYEEGSSNAQLLTEDQKAKLKEDKATLCRRIAYPQPPPRKGMLGNTLPEGPSAEIVVHKTEIYGSRGGGLVSGGLKEQQKRAANVAKAAKETKADPSNHLLPAKRLGSPPGEASNRKGKQPMYSRTTGESQGTVDSAELMQKLNQVAVQQDMVATWGNWEDPYAGNQVPIFDADGTFVCYAPADEDWNMDFQTRDQSSDSDGDPEGVPDEGLYMRGRARQREGAPSPDRR
jgi:hypothetical protein